jgi:hypothetical protein
MSDQDARASQLAAERANQTDPDDCDGPEGHREGCPLHCHCYDEPLECLEDHTGDCAGPVELRMSLSGTGTPFLRCEHHWSKRLDLEAELNERYPVHPPSDWSPLDAGEHWSEEEDY